LDQLQQRLQLAQAYVAQHQQWRWQALRQRLRAVHPEVSVLQSRHADYSRRLREGLARNLERHEARLTTLQQHLQHLDPTQVLARGYSMVRDANGKIVVDSAQVEKGAMLDVTFARGWVRTEVKEKDVH
jgi:exodeoxyribonuclease VII large subunit